MIVGERDVDDRFVPRRGHLGEAFGGPARDLHHRLAGGEVPDRHVLPGDAHAEPGAQRLRAGLFRRPALGIGAGGVGAGLGLALFRLGEDAVAKAVAEPVQRALDPVDVAEVGADAEDHGPLSGRGPGFASVQALVRGW